MPIKAIVTDIEGTTSSLSFVKDVLFPYSREKIKPFIAQHRHEPNIAPLLDDIRKLSQKPFTIKEIGEQLVRWIDEDKKITPLKTLQGLIWEAGYKNGDFTGHIYDDAYQSLRAWHEKGLELCVFSSGSVYAQKLLFAHTAFGDLTPLFSHYFDTSIGNKRETLAYRRICESLRLPPHELLFLSDIKEELDAAHAAGMATVWLVREQALEASASHRQVSNFYAIEI